MILKVALGLVILIAAFLAGVALFVPDDFAISREIAIKAPPEAVLSHIQDLHKFNEWNPFRKAAAAEIKESYEGAPSGVGAVYSWDDKAIGSGKMTIVDASAAAVAMKLEFFKPFAGVNRADFKTEVKDGVTVTSWTMVGKKAFIPKVLCLFVSMDTMMGKPFDEGLAALKTIVENEAAASK